MSRGYSTPVLVCLCALCFIFGRFIQEIPGLPDTSKGVRFLPLSHMLGVICLFSLAQVNSRTNWAPKHSPDCHTATGLNKGFRAAAVDHKDALWKHPLLEHLDRSACTYTVLPEEVPRGYSSILLPLVLPASRSCTVAADVVETLLGWLAGCATV